MIEHLFAPSLLWLMVGLREAESIKRPLKRLERKDIEVRIGDVEKIDPETRRVTVSGAVLEADYLVVSLGAELAPETVPGLPEAGHEVVAVPQAVEGDGGASVATSSSASDAHPSCRCRASQRAFLCRYS